MSFLRGYKTEVILSKEQNITGSKTIGVCRFLYNHFIAKNQEQYEQQQKEIGEIESSMFYSPEEKENIIMQLKTIYPFITGFDFDKYVNNELSTKEEYKWIKGVSSKARKKAIMNAEKAFNNFFKGSAGYPNFKKKKDQDIKIYMPMNNKTDFYTERNFMKLPSIGKVFFREYGYIPTTKELCKLKGKIKSGCLSKKASKWYLSLVIEYEICPYEVNSKIKGNVGIGIDLGIKNLGTLSRDIDMYEVFNYIDRQALENTKESMITDTFENLHNVSETITKLEERLKKEQKNLSRKLRKQLNQKPESEETHKKREKQAEYYKNHKPKEVKTATVENVDKSVENNKEAKAITGKKIVYTTRMNKCITEIQRIHKKITDIKEDYMNKFIKAISINNPAYVTIEDLNLKGMMKNHKLAKSLSFMAGYKFREKLVWASKKYGFELRLADRFFASSKTCSDCGTVHKDLKLADRTFVCPKCGKIIDRDSNASINLEHTPKYKVI